MKSKSELKTNNLYKYGESRGRTPLYFYILNYNKEDEESNVIILGNNSPVPEESIFIIDYGTLEYTSLELDIEEDVGLTLTAHDQDVHGDPIHIEEVERTAFDNNFGKMMVSYIFEEGTEFINKKAFEKVLQLIRQS